MKRLFALSIFCFSAALLAADGGKEEAPQLPEPVLTGDLDFSVIEMIAIQDEGRKKPLHTFAHESIEQIVGRSMFAANPSLKLPDGTKLEMMDMFMSLWLGTRPWGEIPCVLISYKPLKDELGFAAEQKHFTPREIEASEKFKKIFMTAAQKRHDQKDSELTDIEKEVEIVAGRMSLLERIYNAQETLHIIPHPKDANGTWISITDLSRSLDEGSTQMYYSPETFAALRQAYQKLAAAYWTRNQGAFDEASVNFKMQLFNMSPDIYPTYDALKREVQYNKTRPFGKAWYFYLLAFVLGLFALKLQKRPLDHAVLAIFIMGMGMHVYGFVQRCMIAGRPPVSNMYESVIWVAFGVVFFALIFELIYKSRYYVLSGAGGAFVCLILMDQLPVYWGNSQMPGFEAAIKPLQPVLRDNFWLTVHVLTITLSYAAFMLAWVLGHVTLTSHLFRPQARAEHHELHQFIYRVIQVGVLLITIGTILGGVWAYYSWGRFWGWDPKETWAFITLMCYLFVMHGRFTGWWGNFGLSVGSVMCFLSVVMAWYGVNFVLGTGMHSYGSGAGGKEYVLTFVGFDLIYTIAAIVRYQTFQTDASQRKDETLTVTDPVQDARAEFAD